jgi:hypothetical protein
MLILLPKPKKMSINTSLQLPGLSISRPLNESDADVSLFGGYVARVFNKFK